MEYILRALWATVCQPLMLTTLLIFLLGLSLSLFLRKKKCSVKKQIVPLFLCTIVSICFLYTFLPQISSIAEERLPQYMPTKDSKATAQMGLIFFVAIGLRCIETLFLPQVRQLLWKHDNYSKEKVKPRPYCIFNTIWFGTALLVSFFVTLYKDDTVSTIILFVSVIFAAYQFQIYSKRIRYTQNGLFLYVFPKTRYIPWTAVERICWELHARNLGFVLVLDLESGEKIEFPHQHYVGLRNLFAMTK